MNRRGSVNTIAHDASSTGVWRIVIGAFVLVLTPLSLWYAICAVTMWEYTPHTSNPLPIPFVPDLVSYALGLVLMTWGMAALWWLVFKHERLSLRQIALPWWIGLIGGHINGRLLADQIKCFQWKER
jgi:hypothetical protein